MWDNKKQRHLNFTNPHENREFVDGFSSWQQIVAAWNSTQVIIIFHSVFFSFYGFRIFIRNQGIRWNGDMDGVSEWTGEREMAVLNKCKSFFFSADKRDGRFNINFCILCWETIRWNQTK